MFFRWYYICLLLLYVAISACSEEPASEPSASMIKGFESMSIYNLMQPSDTVFTSGQPEKEEFVALAEAGMKHIVNLRPTSEQNWNEAEYIASLGMTYTYIPVASAADLSVDNAKVLQALLDKADGEPVLVHCKSGNRVGALAAILESKLNGKDAATALSEGKRWGLTGLESTVHGMLQE